MFVKNSLNSEIFYTQIAMATQIYCLFAAITTSDLVMHFSKIGDKIRKSSKHKTT